MTENPSVRNRIMGSRLREAREAAGVTIEQVTQALSISRAAAYRQETGHTGISRADAEAYARLYGQDSPRMHHIIRMASTPRRQTWTGAWHETSGGPQSEIAELESIASALSYYDPMMVPGLLQTDAYTAALFEPERERLEGIGVDVDQMVESRSQRKQIIAVEDGPACTFILTQASLAFPVGGQDVMDAQTRYLIDLINEGKDIHIVPFGTSYVSGMSRQIMTATIEGETVVYREGAPTGELIDDQLLVSRTVQRLELMSQSALTGQEAVNLLEH